MQSAKFLVGELGLAGICTHLLATDKQYPVFDYVIEKWLMIGQMPRRKTWVACGSYWLEVRHLFIHNRFIARPICLWLGERERALFISKASFLTWDDLRLEPSR